MSQDFAPKIVTANHLVEGDVIYLTENGDWSRNHRDAEFITDEARAAIRLGFAEAQQERVVGAYLADAKLGPNGPAPIHFREDFRSRGPSNYLHGKQSEQTNV